MKTYEILADQAKNLVEAENRIKSAGLRYHHTASRRGYCHVSDVNTWEPYVGRFGAGVIVRLGRHMGSKQFESISYYVK
jgi:hypothetical protein